MLRAGTTCADAINFLDIDLVAGSLNDVSIRIPHMMKTGAEAEAEMRAVRKRGRTAAVRIEGILRILPGPGGTSGRERLVIEEDKQGRQNRVDAVDRKMAARLLPDAAVRALGRWRKANASTYADGTPSAHTVRYTPGRWAQITPWPPMLAPTSAGGDAAVSRAEVAAVLDVPIAGRTPVSNAGLTLGLTKDGYSNRYAGRITAQPSTAPGQAGGRGGTGRSHIARYRASCRARIRSIRSSIRACRSGCSFP